jgi:hypothetical protein
MASTLVLAVLLIGFLLAFLAILAACFRQARRYGISVKMVSLKFLGCGITAEFHPPKDGGRNPHGSLREATSEREAHN